VGLGLHKGLPLHHIPKQQVKFLMRKIVFTGILSLITAFTAMAQQPKHRVAVLDFGYGSVMTSVQAIFGSNQDVGKGIVDLLINQLVNDGTYRVIERGALDKVMKEQNLSNSDRVTSATAAKIGALVGTDFIIVGDVTQFGRDDKNYGAGGSGGRWGSYGLGNLGLHKAKAVVEVTARMIDVNTGEILASVTGHGESKRSSSDMLGGGASGWTGGSGHLDMGSSNFSQSILGEAVKQSVTQLATALDDKATALPAPEVPKAAAAAPIDGLVADVAGSDLIVNVGSAAGIHSGDKLTISRVSRTIKDPATGKPLRTIESPVGILTVTSVDANSASGKFAGSETPKVGDNVKRP
jgi:curli biogenesis system outer membrane secretion channel CsgG